MSEQIKSTYKTWRKKKTVTSHRGHYKSARIASLDRESQTVSMVTKSKQKDPEIEGTQALKLTFWKESSQTGGSIPTFKERTQGYTLPCSPRILFLQRYLPDQTVTDSLYVTGKDRTGAPGLARNRKR